MKRRWILAAFAVIAVLAMTAGGEEEGRPRPLHILLTNDDGWEATGIQTLKEALKAAGHHVILVAPNENQSGAGAAVANRLVTVAEKGPGEYAVDSTPGTCVFLALTGMLREPPDLVVSGTNDGANLGWLTPFSGTVGAALAAVSCGLPAIAVSTEPPAGDENKLAGREHFAAVAAFTVRLIERLEQEGSATGAEARPLLPPGVALNVNYPRLPPEKVKGVTFNVQGRTPHVKLIYKEIMPGKFRPELIAPKELKEDLPGADTPGFKAGFITIVPIDTDCTARGVDLRPLGLKLGDLKP